jgi:hypothetical protein
MSSVVPERAERALVLYVDEYTQIQAAEPRRTVLP